LPPREPEIDNPKAAANIKQKTAVKRPITRAIALVDATHE